MMEKNESARSESAFIKMLEGYGSGELIADLDHDLKSLVADLLTTIDNFHDERKVKLSSRINRVDGSVNYNYVDEGQPGEGKLPTEIQITAPLFEGGDVLTLTARVRYRTSEGKLAITYKLLDIEKVVRREFEKVARRLSHDCGVPVYLGTWKG